MDNFQVIIYILFAVVYLLVQLFKKKESPEEKSGGDPFETFREEVKTRPMVTDPFKPAKTKADEVMEEVHHEVEEVTHEVEKVKRRIEKAKTGEDYRRLYEELLKDEEAQAAELIEQRRKESIQLKRGTQRASDTSKLQKEERLFKEDQAPKETASPYARLLQNKNTARQAVILSEILNRKFN